MDVPALLAVLITLGALAACVAFVVWITRADRNSTLLRRVEALEREVAQQRVLVASAMRSADVERAHVESSSVRASEPNAESATPKEIAPIPRLAAAEATLSLRPDPARVAPREPLAPQAPDPRTDAPREVKLVSQPPSPTDQTPPKIPPPLAASATTRPAPARTRIEWEQWFGVKGAAVVGGAILALAGLLFVQYSIDRGWLGPAARCSLGALFGLAAMIASAPLRSRRFVSTSDAVTGAGATMILGATWAAFALYELVPFTIAFLAMAATTAVCGILAARRGSKTIAWFGLIGGFATPLLLSLGSNEPIGLFLYLLGLDVALLALARRRAWSAIASAAALATQLLFALWIAFHFDPRHVSWAMLFTGAIALVFTTGRGPGAPARSAWLGSLIPFAFAAYFAGFGELGPHVHALAGLLLVLTICANWLAQRHDTPGLSIAASLGGATTLTTWLASSATGASGAYEGSIAALCLAAVPWIGAELARRRAGRAWTSNVAALAIAPFSACILFGAHDVVASPLTPWIVAAFALAAAWSRLVRIGARSTWCFAAQVTPFFVYTLWRDSVSLEHATWLSAWRDASMVASLAVISAVIAWFSRAEVWFRANNIGTVVVCVLAMFVRAFDSGSYAASSSSYLAIAWICAVIALASARQLVSSPAYIAIAVGAWLLTWRSHTLASVTAELVAWRIAPTMLLGLLIAAAPSWDCASRLVSRNALRMSALVLILWESPARAMWSRASFDWPLWWEPGLLALGGAGLLVRLGTHRIARDESGRRSAASSGFVWIGVAVVWLFASAVSLADGREAQAVRAAIVVVGSAWLARAALHTGMRWFTLTAALATVIGLGWIVAHLAFSPAMFARTGWFVAHGLSYDVGVPALALFAAAYFARRGADDLEGPRWPRLGSLPQALFLLAVLTLFLWLNIEVVNLFSDGSSYAFDWQRRPPRDVALSVAWTGYALALLLVGVRFDRSALRWTSLAFFLATIGKVFLYDLGELRGLHRVGSLVGLALALLAVSMLYQRLVFRSRGESKTPVETA